MLNKTVIVCVVVFSIVLTPFFSLAQSAVWKVQNKNHSLYLAGTIHLLTPDDIPLPTEFDTAFAAADTIVFEADLSGLASPEFQHKMLSSMQLEHGKIYDYLSPENWQNVAHRFKQLGVDPEQLANLKISFVLLNLTMLEIQKAGFTEPGVDERYHKLAIAEKKTMAFLETPEEQLGFLLGIDSADINELVSYTLNDLDSIADYLSSLKTAWRKGDLNAMQAIAIDDFKQDYPNIYNIMLTNRNNKWMKRIHHWLQTPETEAIFVGSLHLAGEDGLIQQLQKSGFQITQL